MGRRDHRLLLVIELGPAIEFEERSSSSDCVFPTRLGTEDAEGRIADFPELPLAIEDFESVNVGVSWRTVALTKTLRGREFHEFGVLHDVPTPVKMMSRIALCLYCSLYQGRRRGNIDDLAQFWKSSGVSQGSQTNGWRKRCSVPERLSSE